MEMILGFLTSGGDYFSAACVVISSLTAITAITPSKLDDKILNTILKVMNMFAGNIGKNKNKDA